MNVTTTANVPTATDLSRIIINRQAAPSMIEIIYDFQPFPKQPAKDQRQINVEIHAISKTRFYLSLYLNSRSESLYLKPAGCETLKYHERPMRNTITGDRFNYYYFVASKKQGMAAMENYIKHVVIAYFDLYGAEENFTVNLWLSRDYRAFEAAV